MMKKKVWEPKKGTLFSSDKTANYAATEELT